LFNKTVHLLFFARVRALSVVGLCACYAAAASASFEDDLVRAALDRTGYEIKYDGAYYSIDYPGGDVPAHIGVCTDVLIRSYRALGIDLQKQVHEDIIVNFDVYPSNRLWGLLKPDTNIDHRRVPNLQVFLTRQGAQLPITNDASDYKAGHIVTWTLPGHLPHIGLVTDRMNVSGERPLIVHNIGAGPKLEDILFDFKITGHYKYVPTQIVH